MSGTEVLLESLTGKKLDQEQNVELVDKPQIWSFDSLEHIAHSPQNIVNMHSTIQMNNNNNNGNNDDVPGEIFASDRSRILQDSVSVVMQLQSQISNSFEISDLLGVLKTQDQPEQKSCFELQNEQLFQQQFQQTQNKTQTQENIDVIRNDVVALQSKDIQNVNQELFQSSKSDDKDSNYQVSDLLFALQEPEEEAEKKADSWSSSKGKIVSQIKDKNNNTTNNSPLQQRFGNNSEQSKRKKTWGDISAEKRPNDRNKYYIIGDTSHLLQDGAFPSLAGNTNTDDKNKSTKLTNQRTGAWSKQSIVKKTFNKEQNVQKFDESSKNQDFPKQGVENLVQKQKSKYKFIPENIIRCVLESVQFDVGIAQQIFREMELEKDFIQESSESEVENNTPTPTLNPALNISTALPPLENHEDTYRKYRKEAFQLGKQAKQLRRRAWRAFRNGSQVEGEGLIKSASEKHVLAYQEHEKAAKQIFSVVNIGFQDNPWKMDLHGLFPEEAAAVVVERLAFLQEFSIYDRSKQPLEIITGRGRHTSDGESILLIAVDNLLKEYPHQHTVKSGSIFVWMGKKRTIVNY